MTTQPAYGMTHGYRVGTVIVATLGEALRELVRQGLTPFEYEYVLVDWSKQRAS